MAFPLELDFLQPRCVTSVLKTLFFLFLLLLLAFFLRSQLAYHLPFHADESTQAWILQQGIKDGFIRYDPHHHHGPAPVFIRKLFLGLHPTPHWEEWSEPLLRNSEIFCGMATLGFLFLLMARHSLPAATLTGLLFACHPYLIYYHSQAIHEPLFVFFGITFLILIHLWKEKQTLTLAIFAGLFASTPSDTFW